VGTALSGDTELIRLTAIDIFTQEWLVDSPVEHGVGMKHYKLGFLKSQQRTCF
jgi:hypothetical protein